jgi:hypothetical protein
MLSRHSKKGTQQFNELRAKQHGQLKREDQAAPAVALSRAQFERLSAPVWSGQISRGRRFWRSLAAGARAGEIYGVSACKVEIARLLSAIDRSFDAINRARAAFIMEAAWTKSFESWSGKPRARSWRQNSSRSARATSTGTAMTDKGREALA